MRNSRRCDSPSLDTLVSLTATRPEVEDIGGDQLADGLEAIFGAVYLDGGFDKCRELIRTLFAERLRIRTERDGLIYGRTEFPPTVPDSSESGVAGRTSSSNSARNLPGITSSQQP